MGAGDGLAAPDQTLQFQCLRRLVFFPHEVHPESAGADFAQFLKAGREAERALGHDNGAALLAGDDDFIQMAGAEADLGFRASLLTIAAAP